jgi:hypothetical protein
MNRRTGLASMVACCAAPALGRDLRVRTHQSLLERVAAARDGDQIEIDEGEHFGQTALVTQRQLTLRARSGRAVLHAQGATLEGKAMFVVRGGDVLIEGVEFRGARVAHRNGAGIRFERGRLTVRRCNFFDNQMGLLAANASASELTVQACEFGQPPRDGEGLYHLLYLGRVGIVRVHGCRLSGARRGHLIKSRAIVSHIVANQLIDDDEASYEIDLPNGGDALVAGNLIVQGRQPKNHVVIAYGAEGEPHPVNRLLLMHNTIVNEAAAPAVVLRSWPERLGGEVATQMQNNLVFGAARPASFDDGGAGNHARPLQHLDRSRWPLASVRADVAALPAVPARSPQPEFEPDLPLGARRLAARERWQPGAFQE